MEKVIEEEQSTLSGDRASTPTSPAHLDTIKSSKRLWKLTLSKHVILMYGAEQTMMPIRSSSEQVSVSRRDLPLMCKAERELPRANVLEQRVTEAPEFHIFLVTYRRSLAEDLYEWGASFQDLDFETTATQAMEAVMITEADLEGMMKILRTEIDRPRF
jgi:hypothetical protein